MDYTFLWWVKWPRHLMWSYVCKALQQVVQVILDSTQLYPFLNWSQYYWEKVTSLVMLVFWHCRDSTWFANTSFVTLFTFAFAKIMPSHGKFLHTDKKAIWLRISIQVSIMMLNEGFWTKIPVRNWQCISVVLQIMYGTFNDSLRRP